MDKREADFDYEDYSDLKKRVESCSPGASAHISIRQLAMLCEEIDLLRLRLDGFSVHGSDGCKNCETGRITIYAKKRWCYDCLAKETSPVCSDASCPKCKSGEPCR